LLYRKILAYALLNYENCILTLVCILNLKIIQILLPIPP